MYLVSRGRLEEVVIERAEVRVGFIVRLVRPFVHSNAVVYNK